MKKELCDHLEICSLSGEVEFDVAMQYGEGLFKICPFKFDRILAVDQLVDPCFQAPYLETGIKGVKRKREHEVATNLFTGRVSSTGNVEEGSNKKLKQDNLEQFETFAINNNLTGNNINRNNYVRAWLENQSNLFFGLETLKLPTFREKSEISPNCLVGSRENSALITHNIPENGTEKALELGEVLEPRVFETNSFKPAENLKVLSTQHAPDNIVGKENEVKEETAPKNRHFQNIGILKKKSTYRISKKCLSKGDSVKQSQKELCIYKAPWSILYVANTSEKYKKSPLNSELCGSMQNQAVKNNSKNSQPFAASPKAGKQKISKARTIHEFQDIVSVKQFSGTIYKPSSLKAKCASLTKFSVQKQVRFRETATVSRPESLKRIFFKTEIGNWAIKNKSVEDEIREVGNVENGEKETEVVIVKNDSLLKDEEAEKRAKNRFEVLQRVKGALVRDRSKMKEKRAFLKNRKFHRIRKQVSNLFEMKARLLSRNSKS